ncbi:uncharacterized protein SOCEGT47_009860 [Sorangium cellulosum]|uniref:Secreted protein n=1 Tax=Sorangium cellulosum TaxID=56 RepID=A0A4P2PV00_SORCE|nr:hypothetical protein [Sorangium cellulosum]AUX20514.1 uncharacterized protein SOCEGT47_009860 [Sorangium cellulosum]
MRIASLVTCRLLAPSLIVASFSLGGCAAPHEDGVAAEESEADLSAPTGRALPDGELVTTLPLPDGAEVRLYAHDDGSFSVTEEGDAAHRAVMQRPEFAEATVFDLFHALATPEQEVPRGLAAYHEAMLAEATRTPTIDSSQRPRGWLLEALAAAPRALSAPSACDTSIQTFVCDDGGAAYPDGPGCFASLMGSAAWYHGSADVRRYRTGFCSTGTVDAQITYGYAGPEGCTVFRPLFILRDGLYANTNWHYWWSGPSGSTPRSYANHVEHVAGAGFAWGVREKYHTSSSCTI